MGKIKGRPRKSNEPVYVVKGCPADERRSVIRTLGKFAKRQQARQWCRNQGSWEYAELIIIHPDGTREEHQWQS